MKEIIFVVGGLFVMLIGGAMWLDSAGCESRWAKSGIQTSWGPMQGCLIKINEGVYVPANAFKGADIIELTAKKP